MRSDHKNTKTKAKNHRQREECQCVYYHNVSMKKLFVINKWLDLTQLLSSNCEIHPEKIQTLGGLSSTDWNPSLNQYERGGKLDLLCQYKLILVLG